MGEAVRQYQAELAKQMNEVEGARPFYIVEDQKPYIAVAGDMAGKEVSGRKQHREYLRRNNFIEVGNEKNEFEKHSGMSPDNPWTKRGE